MDIPHLLAHPDELNLETLYDLRRIVGVYPTYHAARILFLQNLFLLHDTTFDQELRRAALLVPDRRVLCNITQFGGLQPMLDRKQQPEESCPTPPATLNQIPSNTASATVTEASPAATTAAPRRPRKKYVSEDTTLTLLDNFLDSTPTPLQRRRIKADPATDYMAYLSQEDETEDAISKSPAATPAIDASGDGSGLRMNELIDGFITSYQNGLQLPENPAEPEENDTPPAADAGLSATLANIYIKQQKYDRALEIMSKMQNTSSAHNPYLADQVRFLQKLAINSRHKR